MARTDSAQSITGSSSVEVAASIEAAVRSGALSPGAPLPTVRELAASLTLSPTTVAAAYKTLRSRGLLIARGRRGTHVSPRPPIAFSPATPIPEHVRNLASGNPDAALLPDISALLGGLDPAPRLYGEVLGHPELVALARTGFEADGVPADHISVAGGALDAIERLLQAHLRAGDRVAVEDPGWSGVLDLLGALGLEAVPVAVDERGPLPSALGRALGRGVDAFITTPRAHNPTGAAIDAERAEELRAELRPHPDLLVVEDDHMGEVAGAPYCTLLDPQRSRRATVRSVSKSLGPDLRVALVAADATTTARVEGRQGVGVRWVSFLLQQLVVALWKDRAARAALRRATRLYAARREAALAALAARGIEAVGTSGHNVWVPVSDEARTCALLLADGWAVAAGERFRMEAPPALRVTVGDLEPDQAERFAAALERALEPPRRSHAV